MTLKQGPSYNAASVDMSCGKITPSDRPKSTDVQTHSFIITSRSNPICLSILSIQTPIGSSISSLKISNKRKPRNSSKAHYSPTWVHTQTHSHSPQTHHLALLSANTSPLHIPRSCTLTAISHTLPCTSPSVPFIPPPLFEIFNPPSAFLFNLNILPPGLCTASFAGLSFAVIPAGNP